MLAPYISTPTVQITYLNHGTRVTLCINKQSSELAEKRPEIAQMRIAEIILEKEKWNCWTLFATIGI